MKIPLCPECGTLWPDRKQLKKTGDSSLTCPKCDNILEENSVPTSKKALDRLNSMAWSFLYLSLLGLIRLAKKVKVKSEWIKLEGRDESKLAIDGHGIVWWYHADNTSTKLEVLLKDGLAVQDIADCVWALRGTLEVGD